MNQFTIKDKKFLGVLGLSMLCLTMQQGLKPSQAQANVDILIPTECVSAMTHYSEPLMGGTSSVSPCSSYLNSVKFNLPLPGTEAQLSELVKHVDSRGDVTDNDSKLTLAKTIWESMPASTRLGYYVFGQWLNGMEEQPLFNIPGGGSYGDPHYTRMTGFRYDVNSKSLVRNYEHFDLHRDGITDVYSRPGLQINQRTMDCNPQYKWGNPLAGGWQKMRPYQQWWTWNGSENFPVHCGVGYGISIKETNSATVHKLFVGMDENTPSQGSLQKLQAHSQLIASLAGKLPASLGALFKRNPGVQWPFFGNVNSVIPKEDISYNVLSFFRQDNEPIVGVNTGLFGVAPEYLLFYLAGVQPTLKSEVKTVDLLEKGGGSDKGWWAPQLNGRVGLSVCNTPGHGWRNGFFIYGGPNSGLFIYQPQPIELIRNRIVFNGKFERNGDGAVIRNNLNTANNFMGVSLNLGTQCRTLFDGDPLLESGPGIMKDNFLGFKVNTQAKIGDLPGANGTYYYYEDLAAKLGTDVATVKNYYIPLMAQLRDAHKGLYDAANAVSKESTPIRKVTLDGVDISGKSGLHTITGTKDVYKWDDTNELLYYVSKDIQFVAVREGGKAGSSFGLTYTFKGTPFVNGVATGGLLGATVDFEVNQSILKGATSFKTPVTEALLKAYPDLCDTGKGKAEVLWRARADWWTAEIDPKNTTGDVSATGLRPDNNRFQVPNTLEDVFKLGDRGSRFNLSHPFPTCSGFLPLDYQVGVLSNPALKAKLGL
jgi:hypothetical protein